ncbi:MAG: hypothetical protein K6G01_08355 [Eubacterium sp.]|nr:hypothetical protein [Eubacterium sp.]
MSSKKEQSEVEQRYGDILTLSHPVSKKHPRMSREERAAQFSPFAALNGYDEAVEETGRLTDEKVVMDESVKEQINECLQYVMEHIKEQPKVWICYFTEDEKKDGGAYQTVNGTVKKMKVYERQIIMTDGTIIRMDDICAMGYE